MSKNQILLDKYVNEILIKHNLPAITACIVNKNGKEVVKSIAGVRKMPAKGATIKNNTALITDQFNIGSVSKILVGYATALLIQKGKLKNGWQSTTIESVFPPLLSPPFQNAVCPNIHKKYLKASLEMLMSHSTGMPDMPSREKGKKEWMTILNTNPKGAIKRRFKYLCAAIQDKPLFQPMGSDSSYSGGCIIVSSILEAAVNKHFEAIMDQNVFKPMGLKGAGYGMLHSVGKVDGIWQHRYNAKKNENKPIDASIFENYRTNGAAGEAHFSILNMIDFIKNNLPGCSENKNILSGANQLDYQYTPASIKKADQKKAFSRGGWFYFQSDHSKFTDVCHNGDNGKSYAHLELNSMQGYGFAVMTNVSSGNKGSTAVGELCGLIHEIIRNWDKKVQIKIGAGKLERTDK